MKDIATPLIHYFLKMNKLLIQTLELLINHHHKLLDHRAKVKDRVVNLQRQDLKREIVDRKKVGH